RRPPGGDEAPRLRRRRRRVRDRDSQRGSRSVTDRTLRGAAAIVGVADIASPTGELDIRGRALEVAMIRAALDDAGLTLADVDGVCHAGSPPPLAHVPGVPPRFVGARVV